MVNPILTLRRALLLAAVVAHAAAEIGRAHV